MFHQNDEFFIKIMDFEFKIMDFTEASKGHVKRETQPQRQDDQQVHQQNDLWIPLNPIEKSSSFSGNPQSLWTFSIKIIIFNGNNPGKVTWIRSQTILTGAFGRKKHLRTAAWIKQPFLPIRTHKTAVFTNQNTQNSRFLNQSEHIILNAKSEFLINNPSF